MNAIAVGFYVEGNRIKLDLFNSILNVILGIFLNCSYFLHKICIFGAVAVHIALCSTVVSEYLKVLKTLVQRVPII